MSYTFTSQVKNRDNNEDFLDIHFKDKVDGLFNQTKDILMVGWRHDSDKTFVDYLVSQNKEVTIVEIYEPNLKSITQPTIKVVCDDILKYTPDKKYDLFLWQHGPEHVSKEDAVNAFERLSPYFKYLMIETPHGVNHQDEMYGNIYERHISHWTFEDYINLGFQATLYAGKNHDAFLFGYKINH